MGTSNSKAKESKPYWLKQAFSGKPEKASPTPGESEAHDPSEVEQNEHTATESQEVSELTRKYGRSFASEVALLQMMDGGSTEYNIERVLKKRAKKRAKQAKTVSRSAGAVSDSGGLFADQEEREEHERLLPRRGEDGKK